MRRTLPSVQHWSNKSTDAGNPSVFFSRKLQKAERNYSTYDRELLAVFDSVRFFRHFLEDRVFSIKTDHKPLTFAFRQDGNKSSPRKVRQLAFLSQFNFIWKYVKGSENIVADALSRICTIDMPTIISQQQLSEAQQNDEELQHILAEGTTSLQLTQISFDKNKEVSIYCDVSTGKARQFIPKILRHVVLESVHSLSHPGGRSTSKLVKSRYIWPSLRKDVLAFVRNFVQCQRAKIQRHNKLPPGKIDMPNGRFEHIHIELIELPQIKNFRYCLTIVDRFTRWPEAIPITDMTAQTVVSALYNNCICRYGTPRTITSDQGSQFESALFKALLQLIGANKIRTTPYHPCSNGMVERMHRTLKAALMCSPSASWVELLPTALLRLRTCIKEDINASPAEMVYETTLNIPGEFFILEESMNPAIFSN